VIYTFVIVVRWMRRSRDGARFLTRVSIEAGIRVNTAKKTRIDGGVVDRSECNVAAGGRDGCQGRSGV
jgi:hypothetical protein